MNISVVGIDLAKNVFQLCALGANGSVLWNRKVEQPPFRPDSAVVNRS
jgi:transposase